MAFDAQEISSLGEKIGDRTSQQIRIVGARQKVQVGKREPAPGGPQNAELGDTVQRIEQSAREGERVQNFRACRQLFEFNGAEGNLLFAKRRGDGDQ